LADSNLEFKPDLEENKNELSGLYDTLKEVEIDFREKNATINSLRGNS